MSDREDRSRSETPVERHTNGGDASGKRRRNRDHKRSRDSRSPRSYSRSPKRHSGSTSRRPQKHSRRSRSRSGSRNRRRHSRSRSRSGSPIAQRNHRRSRSGSYSRRNLVPAEGPPPNRCLGVFGMSLYTDEKQLENHFSQYGKIENIQLVYDKQTSRSRGFGFIYFETVEDATRAKERSAGVEIDGHRIRVDYSITKRPHTPTPGIYMGKRNLRRGDDYYGGRGGGARSPSPYYPRSRRSRSYSYTPPRR